MWQNDGTGYFTNITAQSGTGCAGYSRGASFADFDNDGDIDLFVNRSTEPKMLYLNDSTGVFTDVSQQSGVFLFANGFGCSTGDINNDGQMDIIAANCCYEQNFVFVNQNADTNFVKVKVKGRNTNTLALGAIILTAHFGTRNASKLAVRVYFQSGAIAQMEGIDPGSTVVIEEPEVVSINDPGAELPSQILIARAYPNPFNSSIRISLAGGEAANYQIDIYNILGKKVRSDKIINNNPLTSFYIWNGRDDSGDRVGSGIYLINIKSGRRQATLKATLLQ
jgi:hypothetical protein